LTATASKTLRYGVFLLPPTWWSCSVGKTKSTQRFQLSGHRTSRLCPPPIGLAVDGVTMRSTVCLSNPVALCLSNPLSVSTLYALSVNL